MIFHRPKAQRLSDSIYLAAPPDEVWGLITAVRSIAEWYDTWDAVDHAAEVERLQVGTSFRLIRHGGGRNDVALCRVTSLEPPWRLCWEQYAPHLPTMSVEFQLMPETNGTAGTRLSHTRSWIEPLAP
ncbi:MULTISPECIES: SRPBCC domain-containing protein [unclassified Mycobacterium]|uniref:SRPBCC domain-containing protein n=1 Tax=unclassified Mycobacterium TaxID=2642494 RepID=UPI0006DD0B88|nr:MULTISPECIES: SRPBCC domain-containing protein [unclassified Mycobacterium]